MCKGFGMVITKELKGYFCEPDINANCSHSETIERLGIKENKNRFIRNFVRIQCPDWKIGSFEFDEDGTLPGWAEENRGEIINLVGKTLKKAAQAYTEYEKVRDQAWAEYKKVRDPALAEYKKVRDQAWAEYKKVRDPAWAEYKKVRDQAQAEFDKVCDQVLAEYKKVRDQAQAEYDKVCDQAWAEFVQKLSTIPGYAGKVKR
jgi:hypothetical protein